MRKAEEGSAFCRKHGDALLGAMLGLLVHGENAKGQSEVRKKQRNGTGARGCAPAALRK